MASGTLGRHNSMNGTPLLMHALPLPSRVAECVRVAAQSLRFSHAS